MINYNGSIINKEEVSLFEDRGFNYGDAVFETIKVNDGKILYWEDHYFRLMASMRIMRMEIPMSFTMEFLEAEISKTITANNQENTPLRVKIIVSRQSGGLYNPETNAVNYFIATKSIPSALYQINESPYIVDLFKDFYISPSLLSTLKTNNKAINVIGNIYAKENDFDNCLLLNTNKAIVEALNGNLFIVKGKVIKTPPISDGCLKGIMRKQVIELIEKLPDYTIEEVSISPFELQKSDELFITNVITGIQPITKYRKKNFGNEVSKSLLQKLNIKVRLN